MSYQYEQNQILDMVWSSCPPLSPDDHKGSNGRIGIVGGSIEYTGAPYFAAMSALRVGADGAHVFCMKDACIPIKSYSPELIVHPLLDIEDPIEAILEWIPRLHALVLGPGLGRKPQIFSTLGHIIHISKDHQLPLVVDADALFYLNDNYDVIEGYDKALLTPNAMEMSRLYQSVIKQDVKPNALTEAHVQKVAERLGVTIACKGKVDIISDKNGSILCKSQGSMRRCMGQGDVISGAAAVLFHWASKASAKPLSPALLAGWGALDLVKQTAHLTFTQKSRSMLTTDILLNIGKVTNNLINPL